MIAGRAGGQQLELADEGPGAAVLSSMSLSRSAAVTALGTTIYAIGGATQPGHVGSTNKAEILDLSGGDASPARVDVKWRKVADAPTKIQYAAAADLGGRAWIFGGIGAGDKPTAETAAYDRAINTWTTGPKLPDPVNHAAAVNYKGEAVVIGGFHVVTARRSHGAFPIPW